MPQKFLHHPQIRAHFQKMGGKGMAQGMGRYPGGDSGPQGIEFHQPFNAAGSEPQPPVVEKNRLVFRRIPAGDSFADQYGPLGQILAQGFQGRSAHRHQPLPVALAGNPEHPFFRIKALQVKGRKLGNPQAR